jgi:hypothetical protein
LRIPVKDLLEASGVDLANVGGFQELRHFQEHLSDQKIIMFDVLNSDRDTFSGNSLSTKKYHLLYDGDNRHYDVITNLKGAMAKRYICNGCDTLYEHMHKCDKCFPCVLLHTKN